MNLLKSFVLWAVGFQLLFMDAARAAQGETLRLWTDGAPGAVGQEEVDIPTLTVSLPPKEKNAGSALVIFPGGGYHHLAIDSEGTQIAEWANSLGMAAFVLRYRIAPRYHHPAPIQDAQRAIRTVRARAHEWSVQPDRIGIIGFSAGGHLASTAGTHFDAGNADSNDPIERVSCRPDFMILCYPVISFTEPFSHIGSRNNLLGEKPDSELVKSLSNEKQVMSKTPPAFLFHTTNDQVVPVENSVAFYRACVEAKVPAELHVYERGKHGVGLAPTDPALRTWPETCANWMRVHGWLPAAPGSDPSAASQASNGAATPPAADLAFRIVAEKSPSSEDAIRPVDGRQHAGIAQHIRDLDEHGAPGARDNLAWFEDATQSKPTTGITSTHEGKRYVLAYTSESETLSSHDGALRSAGMGRDTSGHPSMTLTFSPRAAEAMARLTGAHLGHQMGVFVDNRMVSTATIHSEIRDRAEISGNFTPQQVQKILDQIAPAIPSSQP